MAFTYEIVVLNVRKFPRLGRAGSNFYMPSWHGACLRRLITNVTKMKYLLICISGENGVSSCHRWERPAETGVNTMAVALSPQSTARILADLSQKAAPTPQRAPSNDELEWTDYDADSLPSDLRQAYDDRASAMRLARELESKFETALNDRLRSAKLIGMDDTMLCSYRFGKLRCAVTKTASIQRATKAKSAQMFGFKRA